MPKMIQLYNQHIKVEKGQEIDAQNSDENGPIVIDIWTLIFTDKSYGDQIRIGFPQEARDEIVKELLGGIILPGMPG